MIRCLDQRGRRSRSPYYSEEWIFCGPELSRTSYSCLNDSPDFEVQVGAGHGHHVAGTEARDSELSVCVSDVIQAVPHSFWFLSMFRGVASFQK